MPLPGTPGQRSSVEDTDCLESLFFCQSVCSGGSRGTGSDDRHSSDVHLVVSAYADQIEIRKLNNVKLGQVVCIENNLSVSRVASHKTEDPNGEGAEGLFDV